MQNTEVEPRSSARCQQGRHSRFVHPNADAIAGNARLSNFEECATDLITIADVDGIVLQSLDGEILAELSVDEIGPLQLLLPIAIRLHLVHEDGPVFTPVPGQISLSVTVQIEPADPTATTHRILPDSGVHSAPPPLNVARKS